MIFQRRNVKFSFDFPVSGLKSFETNVGDSMSVVSDQTVIHDHSIYQDRRAAHALYGPACAGSTFPVLRLFVQPIDKDIPNVMCTIVKVGHCSRNTSVDSDTFDEISDFQDDSDQDVDYKANNSDLSTDSDESDEAIGGGRIEVTPLSAEVEQQTLQKDRRNSALKFHWEKVQYHMRHILKKASEEYVSTSGGKLTVRNTVFAHQLVSSGEELQKSGDILMEAGVDLLKYIESNGKSRLLNGIWICEACSNVFQSESERNACQDKHVQEKLEKFTCQICRKEFRSETGIQNHLDFHVNGPFKCGQCEKTFESRSRRNACAKAHGTAKNGYTCEECGKTYSRQDTLKDHMHTHGKERKFSCPRCGARFMNDNMKRQHIHKVHMKKLKTEK